MTEVEDSKGDRMDMIQREIVICSMGPGRMVGDGGMANVADVAIPPAVGDRTFLPDKLVEMRTGAVTSF